VGWTRFFRRSSRDTEFAREIASYIDIETDENIARGLPPHEARARAMRKFGNATRVRENEYLMNTIRLETLWQDVRYALRLLARDRAFALAAILSLTLGIGANTAIFQLLDALRLRALPVPNAHELAEIRVGGRVARTGTFQGRHPRLTYAVWERIVQRQQAFSGLFAWNSRRFNTSPGGEVHLVEGLFVSGNYFTELGVTPILGRVFTASDDTRGCGTAGAVISYAFWQREFGGNANVLSRSILLDGFSFPILGVTPPSFFGMEVGRMYDVAVPLCSDDVFKGSGPARRDVLDNWWLASVGRLNPGWSVDRATEHLVALSPAIFQETLPTNYSQTDADAYRAFKLNAFDTSKGVSNLRTNFEEPLVVLLVTTGLVLVIACANLANLLLARASARGREIAVRLAIGASRGRIVRQLLIESAVLAAIGAALGAWVADAMSRALVGVLANGNPSVFVDLTWNWRMLGFTGGVAFLACLLFGVAPAVRATSLAPGTALKAVGRGLTTSRERFGLRRGLVITQVALSLVLLLGALLFTRTLYNLLTTTTGFSHEGTLAVLITHLSRVADEPTSARVLINNLHDRLGALPAAGAIAQADYIPLGNTGFWNESTSVDGPGNTTPQVSNFNRVGPGFFAALNVSIVAGRDFDTRDTVNSPPVAIVSQEFVKRFTPDGMPLGRIVRVHGAPDVAGAGTFEIVGVVKDTKLTNLRETIDPMVYVASSQEKDPGNGVQFFLRPRQSVAALTAAVTRAVADVSPALNVEFRIVSTVIRDSLLRERLMASLSAAFGVLAALLAAIGLYGVMSYTVARRANEIGIRMAMGALRRDVIRMILGETGWLVAAGAVAGTVLALAGARFTRALLFNLEPTDPTTVGIAIATLAGIGLIAGLVPARRASRVDPAVALRDE
jgi:putative ABC transport system permease protein